MSQQDPTAAATHTGYQILASPPGPPAPPLHQLDQARLAAVELMIFDCDGVLTDGGVYVDAQGREQKRFSVVDGHGIGMLRELGLPVAMITRGPEGISTARARRLGFDEVHTSVLDKEACMMAMLQRRGVDPAHCGYMGDDLPDLVAFARVGLRLAPASARPHVLAAADARTLAAAGHGAAREVCDALVQAWLRLR